MIVFFIGHRGSGKSQLARRLPSYFNAVGQAITVINLDETIEKEEGCSIVEIFEKRGEKAFRELEQKYTEQICAQDKNELSRIAIVVGAGYQGPLPPPYAKDSLCLWVRRPTDSNGRIFLDRPRLNPDKSPLDEYFSRYRERQGRFARWASEEIMISEGFDAINAAEMNFFLNTLDARGSILTLQAHCFGTPEESPEYRVWRWENFIKRRVSWGMRIEVRDDLLTPAQIKLALKHIPQQNILLSLRREEGEPVFLGALREGALWDWPSERSLGPGLKPSILSLHARAENESVLDCGRKLENSGRDTNSHLKLAVPVHSFEDLWQGHLWAAEAPKLRTFLPNSPDGRWSWYRLFMKNPFKLNFVREGEGSTPDQPYLLDWVRAPANPDSFAAVLGYPVGHSRTPAEHYAFFIKRKMPVLAIPVKEEEWDQAIDILQRLGLRAAAVTSPLKLKASKAAKSKTADAERFDSVNTLSWSEQNREWTGGNTDLIGLASLLRDLDVMKDTAVWGSGGTLPLLKEMLPQAIFYSARTGAPRDPAPSNFSPENLIWGVSRSRYSEENSAKWPDPSWKPTLIIDLNYSEDSPGREYAQKVGAQYVSGIEMFRAQAEGQREFWESAGI